jgi:1-deoxy-D-xylulose-5-phosphate reductoisomerase
VLGATGSIGASTLDLVRRNPDAFRVEALTAHAQVEARGAAREFSAWRSWPIRRAWPTARGAGRLRRRSGSRPDALVEACARGADITVAAIVGCAGLAPTMAAIECGKTVALANKEALVSAGEVMLAAVARSGATLLPVDLSTTRSSSALRATSRACADDHADRQRRPVPRLDADRLVHATPAEAIKHPNWSMGAKISVDSATMMNKGLEFIEAFHLFPVGVERLRVLVHPQSIIHSMVEYRDGSTLAQLGPRTCACRSPRACLARAHGHAV